MLEADVSIESSREACCATSIARSLEMLRTLTLQPDASRRVTRWNCACRAAWCSAVLPFSSTTFG